MASNSHSTEQLDEIANRFDLIVAQFFTPGDAHVLACAYRFGLVSQLYGKGSAIARAYEERLRLEARGHWGVESDRLLESIWRLGEMGSIRGSQE